MITPACFTSFQASRDAVRTKSNRIRFDRVRLRSILFDRLQSNSRQIRCSILFDCRTQPNTSRSIEFDWFFGSILFD